MNPRVPYNVGKFLRSWVTGKFSWSTRLHWVRCLVIEFVIADALRFADPSQGELYDVWLQKSYFRSKQVRGGLVRETRGRWMNDKKVTLPFDLDWFKFRQKFVWTNSLVEAKNTSFCWLIFSWTNNSILFLNRNVDDHCYKIRQLDPILHQFTYETRFSQIHFNVPFSCLPHHSFGPQWVPTSVDAASK
jgi:hypothetical protein